MQKLALFSNWREIKITCGSGSESRLLPLVTLILAFLASFAFQLTISASSASCRSPSLPSGKQGTVPGALLNKRFIGLSETCWSWRTLPFFGAALRKGFPRTWDWCLSKNKNKTKNSENSFSPYLCHSRVKDLAKVFVRNDSKLIPGSKFWISRICFHEHSYRNGWHDYFVCTVESNKRLTTGTSRLVTTFIRNGTRDKDERNDYMVIIESSTQESDYSVKRVERVIWREATQYIGPG